MALSDYFTSALFDQLRTGATDVSKSYIQTLKDAQEAKAKKELEMRGYIADQMKTQRMFVPGTPENTQEGYFESPTGRTIPPVVTPGIPERKLTTTDIPDISLGKIKGIESEPLKQPKELRLVNVYVVSSDKGKPKYDLVGQKMGYEDEVRTMGSNASGAGLGLRTEQSLRAEYIKQATPFIGVRDSYNRVKASVKDPTGAGDLSLIFNYMKMLDPGSVVRESEFATAQNSAGVPEIIRAQYNKIKGGERLSEVTRKDFFNRATSLYNTANQQQGQNIKEYSRLASEYGIDPKKVITDVGGYGDKSPKPGGTLMTDANGNQAWVYKDGTFDEVK